VKGANTRKEKGGPTPRLGVVWIEINSALEFLLSLSKFPFVMGDPQNRRIPRRMDERALWRAIRTNGPSRYQFKPFRTGASLQCLEPSAGRDRMLSLHLNLAEGEGGLEL
jgi:hypothetical protein